MRNYKFEFDNLSSFPHKKILEQLTLNRGGSMIYVLYPDRYDTPQKDDTIVVARHGDVIVGWACLDYKPNEDIVKKNSKRFFVYVYVDENFREQGIGSKLLAEIRGYCRKMRYTVKVCAHDELSTHFFCDSNKINPKSVVYY